MDGQCRIELLGGLRLVHADRVVTHFRTQQTGGLLAYLAYHLHGSHPREVLIELLWPEAEPGSGRHKLSVALSSLRQDLEPAGVPDGRFLLADRSSVGLNPAVVGTDVAEFEAALRLPAEGPSPPAAEDEARAAMRRLARAVALYQGPLLPGRYEGWIVPEQSRLQQLYLTAVLRLVGLLEQAGDLAGAHEHALRAVSADPLCEEAHYELMRLYAALGQPPAALRQFRQLQQILAQELATVPGAETRALAREIEAGRRGGDGETGGRGGEETGSRGDEETKSGWNSNSNADVSSPRLPVSSSPRFPVAASPPLEPVGGAVPLASPYYVARPADGEFAAALRRGDSIVLVKGPRQVGKTSLLARGLHGARQFGARVVQTDFQTLNEAHLESVEALFLALGSAIGEQLELGVMPLDVWEPRRGANPNFRRYLRREVLGKIEETVVWGMDEVDRLFTCSFGGEVFALFRSWHNERALDPSGPWGRLTLAIAHATEAHLFVTDLNQSPFNVGTRLTLEDFTFEQVAELNERYGRPLPDQEELARFYRLVGGHPYLVRRGLHELALTGGPRPGAAAALEADAAREDGSFGDHVRRLRLALDRDPELRSAAAEVLQGRPCPSAEAFYRLRSAGVLLGDSPAAARPRCQLYASLLPRPPL